ncbi:hypothetical protein Bca4012_102759 [Brassica carinata]
MAHLELSIPWDGSTKQPPRPTYLKFENRSRTLRPDASNHWLYPIELASELQLSRGKLRGNQLLDGSISLSPLYPSQTNDLHARSPWPPPEFLWLRPPGIVHHLSVPTGMLTLNPSRKIKVGRLCTREGSSQSASLRLTGLLHPLTRTHVRLLVRVSRRVEWGAHRPTPEHADAEARREARAADHDKAATPPLAQRRGATGSGTTGSHLSGALSRELGPGPPLRTLPDYTNAKTPDFQAGLFPFAATKGILDWGRRFVTPSRRASPEGLGRNLRSKTRWFTDSAIHTKYRFRHALHRCEPRYPLPSRFRLYIAAPLPTNTASGWRKQADQPGSIHKSRQALVMFPQTHGKREQTKTWPPSLSETNVLSRTEFLRVTAIIFPQPRSQQTACSPWRTMHKLCKDVRITSAAYVTVRQHAYQHADPSRGLSGDFRHEDCPSVRISARWPFPWTIRGGDIRHEDCPRVIFATRTVRQYTYQHAGPSRGLSGLSVGDFRHEDCPRVIFATRTVRQHAYQHAGPSRGLSGDFRHDDYPPVCISARWPFPRTIRGRYSPRGLSAGDFRHEDCPPVRISARWPFPLTVRTHISTLALPVDCPVIFATMTIRQYAYQHAGPSRGLSVEIFATRTVRGDFRHEDCPPVRISARWPFPWTIRGDFRHEDCPWVIFATRTVRG